MGDNSMDIGFAKNQLENGHRVTREVWKDKFIYLVRGQKVPTEFLRNEAKSHLSPGKPNSDGHRTTINSHIDMKQDDGSVLVGWTPSCEDFLANDWKIFDGRV